MFRKNAKLSLEVPENFQGKVFKMPGDDPRNTIRHTHQLGCVGPGIFSLKTVVALHENIYFGSGFSILR